MAKTGSLLGRADTTLVQGSFREAAADRPADLTKLYERKADKFGEFLDMVGSAFDTKTQADKDREDQYTELQELLKEIIDQTNPYWIVETEAFYYQDKPQIVANELRSWAF